MQIQVRGYLTYRELLGTRQVEVSIQPATMRDCLHVLEEEIGKEFCTQLLEAQSSELQPHVALLLNGQHYRHPKDWIPLFTKVTSWLSFRPSRAGERNGESEKKELLLEVPYGWAVIQWDIAEGRLAYQMNWWILPEGG